MNPLQLFPMVNPQLTAHFVQLSTTKESQVLGSRHTIDGMRFTVTIIKRFTFASIRSHLDKLRISVHVHLRDSGLKPILVRVSASRTGHEDSNNHMENHAPLFYIMNIMCHVLETRDAGCFSDTVSRTCRVYPRKQATPTIQNNEHDAFVSSELKPKVRIIDC